MANESLMNGFNKALFKTVFKNTKSLDSKELRFAIT